MQKSLSTFTFGDVLSGYMVRLYQSYGDFQNSTLVTFTY